MQSSLLEEQSIHNRGRKDNQDSSLYRMYVTIIYAGVLGMTGLFASPFSPFAKTAKRIYDIDLDQINLTASLFSLASMISGLPANYLVFKFGIRKSLLVSCGFFFAGNSIKLLATVRFEFVLLGQFVAGLGVPFVVTCTAKFAAHWYEAGRPVIFSPYKNSYAHYHPNYFLMQSKILSIESYLHYSSKYDEPNRNDIS